MLFVFWLPLWIGVSFVLTLCWTKLCFLLLVALLMGTWLLPKSCLTCTKCFA